VNWFATLHRSFFAAVTFVCNYYSKLSLVSNGEFLGQKQLPFLSLIKHVKALIV